MEVRAQGLRGAHVGVGRLVIGYPSSIAYTGLHGFPLGRQHRPVVAWYGDFALGPHLMGVLRRGAIDVVLTWGEPIPFDETSDRKAVARALEASVRRQMAAALRGRAAA